MEFYEVIRSRVLLTVRIYSSSVFAGRLTDLSFKNCVQTFFVTLSGQWSDLFQGHLCFTQLLFDFGNLDCGDFLVRRAVQFATEPAFQLPMEQSPIAPRSGE